MGFTWEADLDLKELLEGVKGIRKLLIVSLFEVGNETAGSGKDSGIPTQPFFV